MFEGTVTLTAVLILVCNVALSLLPCWVSRRGFVYCPSLSGRVVHPEIILFPPAWKAPGPYSFCIRLLFPLALNKYVLGFFIYCLFIPPLCFSSFLTSHAIFSMRGSSYIMADEGPVFFLLIFNPSWEEYLHNIQ